MSRSGYYVRLKREEEDSLREDCDYADYLLLKQLHNRRHYMEVLDLIGSPMNHKRILRLMRKYGIVTKTRTKNAYRKLAKTTQEYK